MMKRTFFLLLACLAAANGFADAFRMGFEEFSVGATAAELTNAAGSHFSTDAGDGDVSVEDAVQRPYAGNFGYPSGFSSLGNRLLRVKTAFSSQLVSIGVTPNEDSSVGAGVVQQEGDSLVFDVLTRPTIYDEDLPLVITEPIEIPLPSLSKSLSQAGTVTRNELGLSARSPLGFAVGVDWDIFVYPMEVYDDSLNPVATNWYAMINPVNDGTFALAKRKLVAVDGSTMPDIGESWHRITLKRQVLEGDVVCSIRIDGRLMCAADDGGNPTTVTNFHAILSKPTDPVRAMRFMGQGCVDDVVIGPAYDVETVGGIVWTYLPTNDTSVITGVPTDIGGRVTIPPSLGGRPVSGIAAGAFRGWKALTAVIFPSCVTSIGANAFAGCSALTTVYAGASDIGRVRTLLETSGLNTQGIDFVATGLADTVHMGFEEFSVGATAAELTSAAGSHFCTDAEDGDVCVADASQAAYAGEYGFPSGFASLGSRMLRVRTRSFSQPQSVNIGVTANENGWIGCGIVQQEGESLTFDALAHMTLFDEELPYVPPMTGSSEKQRQTANALREDRLGLFVVVSIPGLAIAVDEDIAVYPMETEMYDNNGWYTITNWCVLAGAKSEAGGEITLKTSKLVPADGWTMPDFGDGWHRVTLKRQVLEGEVVYSVRIDGRLMCAADDAGNPMAVTNFLAAVAKPTDPVRAFRFTGIGSVDDVVIDSSAVDEPFRGAVRNVSARVIEPWGLVEIPYELTENVAAPTGMVLATSVVCEDRQHGTNYTARTFVSPPTYERGRHTLLWDARADGVALTSTDVVFRVSVRATKPPLYCVIDVSGGTSAASYPVTQLADVPAGGWTDEYKTTKIVLRYVEPGTFRMGGSYNVTLTKPFCMGVFELTQRQWELVMGTRPSQFSNYADSSVRPVERVSYNMIRGGSAGAGWPANNAVDADSFVGVLRAKTGLDFDLPTEAQWEYACRAGTTTTYSYGNNANGDYMWHSGNSDSQTHEVGTRKPNDRGLYDMHGNVCEWCLDRNGKLGSATDPMGPTSGTLRVVRGGSFNSGASSCTSSYRYDGALPSSVYNSYGLRLSRTLQALPSNLDDFLRRAGSAESSSLALSLDPRPQAIASGTSLSVEYSPKFAAAAGDKTIHVLKNGETIVETADAGTNSVAFGTSGVWQLKHQVLTNDVVAGEFVAYIAVATDGAVAFQDGWTEIPAGLFRGCDWLTAVTIPSSVTNIGKGAFEGCAALTMATIRRKDYDMSVFPSGCQIVYDIDYSVTFELVGHGVRTGGGALEQSVHHGNAAVAPQVQADHGWSFVNWDAEFSIVTDPLTVNAVWSRVKWPVIVTNPDGTVTTNEVEHEATHEFVAPEPTVDEDGARQVVVLGTTFTVPDVTNRFELAVTNGHSFAWNVLQTNYWFATDVTTNGQIASETSAGWKADGSALVLTAVPDEGYRLLRWIGDVEGCVRDGANLVVTMDRARQIGAMFSLIPHQEKVGEVVWSYLIQDGVATVANDGDVAVSGEVVGALIVPATLGGYPVRVLGEGALRGCTNVTAIAVPQGLLSVGDAAFAGCTALESVELEAVTNLGVAAFCGCSNLVSVTMAEGIAAIGPRTFKDCAALEELTIPASVQEIGEEAFAGCASLKKAEIPEGVTEIAVRTFAGCAKLSSVDLSESLVRIGEEAFVGCATLGSVTIPANVTEIGLDAFGDCRGLNSARFYGQPPTGIRTCGLVSEKVTIHGPADVSISPEDRTVFGTEQAVTLATTWEGGVVRYTLDGSAPTAKSPVFGGIVVHNKTTVRAATFVEDLRWSEIAGATYGVGKVKTPEASSTLGDTFYHNGNLVALECATPGVEIRYTFGGEPTANSTLYTGPFEISRTTTVKAKAFGHPDYVDSDVMTQAFVRAWEGLATPVISPAGGLIEAESELVAITCESADVQIYYTLDGSRPSATNGRVYTAPFKLYQSAKVKVIATKFDWQDSEIASATFTRGDQLGEALNYYSAKVTDDASAPWSVDTTESHDGVSSVKSTAVAGGQSGIKLTVKGAGRLSFWWKASCEDVWEGEYYDYGSFKVGSEEKAKLAGQKDWRQVVCDLETTGKHTLHWDYVKDDDNDEGKDCIWVDQVVWVPADGSAATLTTGVPVPYGWLANYGLGLQSDFETAANAKTGKRSAFGRELTVWEDYVAGTNPTNLNSVLRSFIDLSSGTPKISWEPDLNENGTKHERNYQVWGAKSLDGQWFKVDGSEEEYNFFKTSVELP